MRNRCIKKNTWFQSTDQLEDTIMSMSQAALSCEHNMDWTLWKEHQCQIKSCKEELIN